eukprot:GHVP01068487.1.p1 GENE.GHVP01068487.1~~GHVP01068487.1.p1  ORF type:complete len:304 (-),score=25.28 GHVP01068487.1:129-1040(-)
MESKIPDNGQQIPQYNQGQQQPQYNKPPYQPEYNQSQQYNQGQQQPQYNQGQEVSYNQGSMNAPSRKPSKKGYISEEIRSYLGKTYLYALYATILFALSVATTIYGIFGELNKYKLKICSIIAGVLGIPQLVALCIVFACSAKRFLVKFSCLTMTAITIGYQVSLLVFVTNYVDRDLVTTAMSLTVGTIAASTIFAFKCTTKTKFYISISVVTLLIVGIFGMIAFTIASSFLLAICLLGLFLASYSLFLVLHTRNMIDRHGEVEEDIMYDSYILFCSIVRILYSVLYMISVFMSINDENKRKH